MQEHAIEGSNQYLTFTLDNGVYALDIASVREVLEMTAITRVPRTPEFMRGVINLRGNAVPVVDMRRKFGMSRVEDTINTCIIILEIVYDGEAALMGTLVDAVREVIEIRPEDIQPAPRMGTSVASDFIKGMGRQGDEFIIILDIQKLFSTQELTAMQATGAANQAQPEAVPTA